MTTTTKQPDTAEKSPHRTRFLDIHTLHSVPFANLNRDDLGQPKEAHYGGVRRIRVSSQCLKRAVRQRLQDDQVYETAVRTKRLPAQIAELLVTEHGWADHPAAVAAVAVMHTAGFSPAKGSEKLSVKITFCPAHAADRIADAVETAGDMLRAVIGTAGSLDDESDRIAAGVVVGDVLSNPGAATTKKVADAEKAARQPLAGNTEWVEQAAALTTAVAAALNDVNPMIALMGRMYASMPKGNVDGAVQVAHAITTHAAVNDGDYFTTVDDLNTDTDTGAGFLDIAEYASGVFYKYATVDLDAFAENLDSTLTTSEQAELVAAFAGEFARTMSNAKKRVTAPHTPPSLVLVVARDDRPVSYANAFERPVTANDGYIAASVDRLLRENAADIANNADSADTGRWLYISPNATDSDPSEQNIVRLADMAGLITGHLTDPPTS